MVAVFALSALAMGQQAVTKIVPTTTVAAETANNTSAANNVATLTAGHNPGGNMSKEPVKDLLYPGAGTKIYAAVMGWFGKSSHINVGYNSQDSTQVKKQVEDMQGRGIDGAILAWYGAKSYEDTTAKALMQQAQLHPGFSFAIMIDKGTLDWNSMGMAPTDALIYHLNYIAKTYYPSASYMRINGRPVIFEFALEFYTIDWARVRSSIQGNPLIIFRNPNGWARPLSDGAYAWAPDDGDLSYLEYFYGQSLLYPKLITWGGSSYGFNDSLASWSANRFADPQCGQTWLNTMSDVNKHYSTLNPLNYLQIATWNDYEEGTGIEGGIDNCLSISASQANQSITWVLGGQGQENTLDHYTVFISSDGQNLMALGDAAPGTYSMDLSGYRFAPGSYALFVKAVGKNSIANHMSNGAALVVPNKPPVAALSLDTTSGLAPVSVNASTAASSDSDGSIASSTIDFGDGSALAGPTAAHTYKNPGTYIVTGTVTDDLGAGSNITSTVIVSAPYVTITRPARPTRDGSGNLVVATSSSPVRLEAAASSGAPIDTVSVAVDNVGRFSARSTSGVAADLPMGPGTHQIVVTSLDTNGLSAQSNTMVTVPNISPTAVMDAALDQPVAPATVSVSTAGSSDLDGRIAASSVDFGDGSSAAGTSVSHTYANPGTYTVTATVTDDLGAQSSTITTIQVLAPGVFITSPANAASVTYPSKLLVNAFSRSAQPISSMIVYVDDVLTYRVYASSLSTSLALSKGTHVVLIKSWTSTGFIYRASVTVTVK
jgi:PKD repeat protein